MTIGRPESDVVDPVLECAIGEHVVQESPGGDRDPIPGLLDQKYTLQSQRLGDGSDLADALGVPCGALLNLAAMRVRSATPGREILELRRLAEPGAEDTAPVGGSVVLTVGSWGESAFLAYVGRNIVILSDYHHWKVLPRPGGR